MGAVGLKIQLRMNAPAALMCSHQPIKTFQFDSAKLLQMEAHMPNWALNHHFCWSM